MCLKVDHLDRRLTIFVLLTLQPPHASLLIAFRAVVWMGKPSHESTWDFLAVVRIKVSKEEPYLGNQEPTHSLCVITNSDKNSVKAR